MTEQEISDRAIVVLAKQAAILETNNSKIADDLKSYKEWYYRSLEEVRVLNKKIEDCNEEFEALKKLFAELSEEHKTCVETNKVLENKLAAVQFSA
jgi:predicted  nucleic acid-binding Zn-ribbon protein